MIEIRRKSTWMLTEFFQGNSFGGDDEIYRDLEYYDQFCNIENSYQGAEFCSGNYNNGFFYFYPPFAYDQCQCNAMSDFVASDEM